MYLPLSDLPPSQWAAIQGSQPLVKAMKPEELQEYLTKHQ